MKGKCRMCGRKSIIYQVDLRPIKVKDKRYVVRIYIDDYSEQATQISICHKCHGLAFDLAGLVQFGKWELHKRPKTRT